MTSEERISEIIKELILLSNKGLNTHTISKELAKQLSFRVEHPTITAMFFNSIITGFQAVKKEYRKEIPHHTDERLKYMHQALDKLER